MHEDPVVHGEAASPPRIQKIDPLLAQQPSAAEKSEHLVAEELLGHSLIHVRQRDPLPRSRPATPGTERVDVGVELRPLAEGLDHRHHPGAKALLLHGRRRHQLLDRLVGGQRERAEKLAVVQEVDPQHLGDREHPLGMAHLLHDLVHETPPEAVAALEALLPRALDPLVERLEKAVERCLPGVPGSVDPASDLHAQPEAGRRGTGGKRRRASGPAFPTTASSLRRGAAGGGP
jgi:hypothetical protein